MKKSAFFLAAFVAVFTMSLSAQNYRPAGDRIMTEWGTSMTPKHVWAEYPRPMMARDKWQNLNGEWDYAITPKDASQPVRWDGKILVPFCVESSLSGVGKALAPDHALWYHRTFKVSGSWLKGNQHVLLNFGAVDWQADVWLNGVWVGRHQGGYAPFSIDLNYQNAVKKGVNDLVVKVVDGTDTGYQPCGKQTLRPRSIWYTAVSGIWQTVWVEPVKAAHIDNLVIVPDLDAGTVSVKAVASVDGVVTTAKVLEKGKVIAEAKSADADEPAVVRMPAGFKMWSPDAPNLYDLEVSVSALDGKTCDKVRSYFAMRKFSAARDANGIMRLQLNNEDIFELGPLDQGWWPDGLYTAPSYEAMCYDLDKTKRWGFNMIRKHVKVEPALWYNYCDRKGIIVWQDMPSGDYKHGQPWEYDKGYYRGEACTRTPESIDNYYREWGEIIDNFRNYPCISTWVPFNEAWGQFNTWSVTNWTRSRDPYHLINPASGGNFYACGDMIDLHHYPEPKMFYYEPDRVNVLGEYGGIGLPVKGHTWAESDKNWGYIKFTTTDEVTDKYVEFADMLIDLARKGFSAAVYTQTTDCELEVNGIMTYDRKVVKMQEDRIAEANKKVINCLKK